MGCNCNKKVVVEKVSKKLKNCPACSSPIDRFFLYCRNNRKTITVWGCIRQSCKNFGGKG